MIPSSNNTDDLVPYYTSIGLDPRYEQYWNLETMKPIFGPNSITWALGTEYQWGFSLGWFYLIVSATIVWCWGMFGLWFDAQKCGKLWRKGRRPGLYRNIVDIAGVIQEALGEDMCAYNDAELTKEIEKIRPVGFEVGIEGEGRRGHIVLCREPGGCEALQDDGVEYGRRRKEFVGR